MNDNVAYELTERNTDPPAERDAVSTIEVVDYLRRHPEFLLDHPELLDHIELPGPPEPAASLHHWQLRRWRNRARRHQDTLERLHRVAEENACSDRLLHGFCRALLGAARNDTASLERIVADGFEVDAVRVIDIAILDAAVLEALDGWLDNPAPRCGRLAEPVHQALFGVRLPETGSAALIAIRDGGNGAISHVLALGRQAPDGFNPAQGTHFLEQIGELAGAFLAGAPNTPSSCS
jgi:hypothetical protein